MKGTKAAGTRRELQVVKLMKERGFVAFRTPASMGVCDVIAMRRFRGKTVAALFEMPDAAEVQMIEVKSCATGSVYKHFPRLDREALRLAAEVAGAEAWLYHWPPHGELREIPASDWPPA